MDEAVFCGHLERLGWRETLPPFVVDVYLACACGLGQEAACRLFDRTYAGVMKRATKGICRVSEGVQEIEQVVREKLFVGPPPGLLKYSGRSSLEAWLRLVVKRAALDAQRAARRSARREALAMNPCDLPAGSFEAELDRRRHAAFLQLALSRALEALPSRDSDLLRLYYASGVGIDALGRAFGVHRSTAARWIEKIESELGTHLRHWARKTSRAFTEDELRELLVPTDRRTEFAISGWSNVLELELEA